MTVQILGTGCPKCRLLKANTAEVVEALRSAGTAGIELEEITDLDTMMEMGMLVSPGFAIDGELVQAGKVLSTDQIRSIIQERVEPGI
ncbi:MAG: thioredoxin family protein [Spirochaetota bacterium]